MTPDWPKLIRDAWNARNSIIEEDFTDSWRLFHGYDEGASGVDRKVC